VGTFEVSRADTPLAGEKDEKWDRIFERLADIKDLCADFLEEDFYRELKEGYTGAKDEDEEVYRDWEATIDDGI